MAQMLARTSLEGVRLVGSEGRNAHDAAEELEAVLRARISEDAAAFLAQPTPSGAEVIWFTERTGDAVPLSQLPEAERAAAVAASHDMLRRLTVLAAEMEADKNLDVRRMASMLRAALSTGGTANVDKIYMVGGRPVLVGWGASDETQRDAVDALESYLELHGPPKPPRRFARQDPIPEPTPVPEAQTPVPPPTPVVVVEPRPTWLPAALWFLFVAIVAWIYWLLFVACGLAGLADHCAAPRAEGQGQLLALHAERERLQNQIALAELRATSAPSCPIEPIDAPAQGAALPEDPPAPTEAAGPALVDQALARRARAEASSAPARFEAFSGSFGAGAPVVSAEFELKRPRLEVDRG